MGEILAWTGMVFVVGSALVLERRCLGQMAIVQPLVVCLIAGWLSENELTAIWLGISLQLFSVDKAKEIDWSLAGVVTAAVLLVSKRFDLVILPGDLGAVTTLMAAVIVGIASRTLELKYARIDGQFLKADSPWASNDPAGAIESIVRKVVLRWVVIGGIEVTAGTAFAVLAVLCAEFFGRGNADVSSYTAAVVIAFGAAVAASSLSKKSLLAWTGISAAVSWAVFI